MKSFISLSLIIGFSLNANAQANQRIDNSKPNYTIVSTLSFESGKGVLIGRAEEFNGSNMLDTVTMQEGQNMMVFLVNQAADLSREQTVNLVNSSHCYLREVIDRNTLRIACTTYNRFY